MRSRKNDTITSEHVHGIARRWLLNQLSFQQGYKCTAPVLLNILLLAAARATSIFDVCRDLVKAPSAHAVLDALEATLPDAVTLEKRLNQSLCADLPRALRRRKWAVAIDLTLIPYYGKPHETEEEIYRSQPKSGTSNFHSYATACVIHQGFRYTLGLVRVTRGEKMESVVKRLLRIVRDRGVTIAYTLLYRGFFTFNVMQYLKRAGYPFVIPVVMRGRKKKDSKATETGLRQFKTKRNGCYPYKLVAKKKAGVNIDIYVASKRYEHKKTGKLFFKKLVFAVSRLKGLPKEIREQYRKRFGIESSYRQMNQARIRTCARDPVLRLLFVGIALVLRNVWVWLHYTYFAEKDGPEPTLHLEMLRLKRMLRWIAQIVERTLHTGDLFCVDIE